MAKIGYHASHEQFTPRDLLSWAQAAEQAGFDCLMSSDHLAPWSERQGQSGFAWAWLGATLQATQRSLGLVTVPCGWRYHPAITAQAGATLAQMFPRRLAWLALGTGEALNEHVVGGAWPDKAERKARLREAVDVIRELWAGRTVTRDAPIAVSEARLYTLPDHAPSLIAAALTSETAEWAGEWADGLITVNQAPDKLAAIVEAFRRGGGAGKPLYLQVHISYARSDDEARQNAFDQWRSNAISAFQSETLRTPGDIETATRSVQPEDLDAYVRISSDLARHVAWIEEDIAAGFDEIYLHNVGRNQLEFIEAFGASVLPRVSARDRAGRG
ncbi:TIGR03885 family FMN-dependent LLM class oxidoreductase [Sinorhizobium psoraleae]|uniref:TIGR03885 family FMN-dependent LLM class oxidoreductase n=1 Tax=Sinorhizobium psoraleae TaxID=520838 RepID=A0ABT4KC79_9HYPH|nr:TIGR03885 family FMN-dependent LLM class oxidoreductase [Sinorhizobium psoraleae]MCZ4088966.1 TIGR03885 family FMN-dependent LLM class oxidoreductase [Sinorhizobium psoraleae]